MQKHNVVRSIVAGLACLVSGALSAQGAGEQRSRSREPQGIEYRLGTGAISGVPVVAGRKVRIRFLEQNPLCYSYAFDVKPHLAAIDLAQLLTGFGPLAGTTTPAAPAAVPAAPQGTKSGVDTLQQRGLVAATVTTVETEVAEALRAVEAVRSGFQAVEAALALVEKPTCDGTVPLSAVTAEWGQRHAQDTVAALQSRINTAQSELQGARLEHAAAAVNREAAETSRLAQLDTTIRSAGATLDSMARARPELARRTARASAIIRGLPEVEKGTETEVYVPQGTDTLHLAISRRELHPADGKPATPVLKTVALPVRNGMRFFLSAGAMASGLDARDYQRVTRAYADTTKGVYSTFANVSRGNALAFSPVLQGNVAFPELGGTGVSLLGNAGIAVRSVNGSNAPEFLLGVGLAFLDRMVLSVGAHMGRRERLLIGGDGEVEARPVPQTITDASAIGVEWKPAFVTTFSIRLN